jgi:hypothetical protein
MIIIFITLALALAVLIIGVVILNTNTTIGSIGFVAGFLLLIGGFIGVALSGHVLSQTRRRIMRLRIETQPITTTIECKKCGFKNVREFQRGDYVFKELEPCQKCNDKMMITAIFREVKEKGREPSSP